ncbi:MAG: NTP transferase domain-containing protein, partial [bacterium]|nr:NTP transferase domain-containing protein [bacterium]
MIQANKKVLGVIPARLGSTRVSRKMLADICGKPLIYYTYQQAKKAKSIDALIVATDAKEVADAVESFGGRAIMTSPEHPSGSDRTAEAVDKFNDFIPEVVVTIWGDEPFVSPEAIDKAVEALKNAPESIMATTV